MTRKLWTALAMVGSGLAFVAHNPAALALTSLALGWLLPSPVEAKLMRAWRAVAAAVDAWNAAPPESASERQAADALRRAVDDHRAQLNGYVKRN